MKKTILSMIAVVGIAAAAPVAQGQGYNPFQIGASGGIAFPTGDLGTGTNTGYNIAVVVGYKPQGSPLSVRGEAAYNQFGFSGGGGPSRKRSSSSTACTKMGSSMPTTSL